MDWNRILVLTGWLVIASPSAAQHDELREAARLDNEGRCDASEPYYQRALARGEPSEALLNNVGNHYVACEQPGTARTYFERLLATNPAHPNANLQLARIFTEQKQGARALEHLGRVSETGPAIALLRGEALHWAGRRSEAIATMEQLGGGESNDPRVTFSVGLAFARMGLYDKAEAAFSAVLTALPGNFDVLMNLGRAAARAGHYERARRALESVVKARPDDVNALFELGLAHAADQDPSRAVFVLAQARQKAPHRPDILLALAQAAEDAQYYGDAVVAFDEYLAIRPEDDAARRDRARCAGRTETHREQGLQGLAAYIARHPDDARAHYDLAHLTWQETPEEALGLLAEALRLDPEFSGAHVSRAWLLNRLGRTEEAVAHFETAIRIAPKDVRALDQLSLAYLTLDDAPKAEEMLRRALDIAPEDPQVLLHLGQTLMALGRAEEAQGFLDEFQRVRPAPARTLRTEAGMIELAGLPTEERRRRQIDRFRRLAQSRPDDPGLRLHLAEVLLADGRSKEAATEFRSLLASNAPSETKQRAGQSLLHEGIYELARDFLEAAAAETTAARLDFAIAVLHTDGPEEALKVLEDVPQRQQSGDFFLLKARILDVMGKTEEAFQVLHYGLGRGSSRPELARSAAILLAGRQRTAEALQLLDQALESTPDNPDLVLAKAIVLGAAGQVSGSEESLARVQTHWPEWDRPYLVHGLLLEQQGQFERALAKIRVAAALGSDDSFTVCAIARLKGSSNRSRECDCTSGLSDLLAPRCVSR